VRDTASVDCSVDSLLGDSRIACYACVCARVRVCVRARCRSGPLPVILLSTLCWASQVPLRLLVKISNSLFNPPLPPPPPSPRGQSPAPLICASLCGAHQHKTPKGLPRHRHREMRGNRRRRKLSPLCGFKHRPRLPPTTCGSSLYPPW
jgi:hypothetical protein